MAFCSNCGAKLKEGVKFCSECGSRVENEEHSTNEKRKTVFEGAVHKCTNCGEVLPSFVLKCPSCGYEIRDTKSSRVIEEFSKKLSECESINKTIQVIRTFPIPNTKEDLFEFLVVAKTNMKRYDKNGDGVISESEEELLNAWLIKVDQCIEKAKILISDSKDLELFEKAREEITIVKSEIANVKQNIKNEKISDDLKEEFKRSKGAKIAIIIGIILNFLWLTVAFSNGKILAGLVALIAMGLQICAFLIGYQAIKIRIRKIYILPIVLSYVLFIPYLSLVNLSSGSSGGGLGGSDPKDDYETIVWSNFKLGDKVPDLGITEAEVIWDIPSSLIFYVYDFTDERYEAYIQACKDFGYTIDIDDSGANWSAYNSEGYKLHLSFWDFDDDKKFTLDLDDPIKKNTIYWPSSSLVKNVPVPKSLIGEVSTESDEAYAVYLTNIEPSYFNEYVNLCMSNGFNIDYSKSEDYFHAENKNGVEITVEYEGFNILYIYVSDYDWS